MGAVGWAGGWVGWVVVGGWLVGGVVPPNAQLAAWALGDIRALPPLRCTPYSPAVGFGPCTISTTPSGTQRGIAGEAGPGGVARTAMRPSLTPLYPGEGSLGGSGGSPRGSCTVNARSTWGPGGCSVGAKHVSSSLPGVHAASALSNIIHVIVFMARWTSAMRALLWSDGAVGDAVGVAAGPMGSLAPSSTPRPRGKAGLSARRRG